MRRACLILVVVALFAGVAFAGHALNSPVATTNPGDFWVSGNMDCDGTSVWDGVATFNADAIFTLDVSVGSDLTITDDVTCDSLYVGSNATVSGDVSCDSLYVGSNLTVTDTLTVSGELKGARVWLGFISNVANLTVDDFLYWGERDCTGTLGAPMPVGGQVRSYAVQYYVDTATDGYCLLEIDINGVRALADSFNTATGTGLYANQRRLPRDSVTFSAGDILTAEFDKEGLLQIDKPAILLDLQLDE